MDNRLTRQFNLTSPLVLAPMALASGGALAAAWARGGALGLVGGGYGDLEWTRREYHGAVALLLDDAAMRARLGCGFMSWKLEEDCSAFDWLLDQPDRPAAVMLSFGDPARWIKRLSDAGIPAICQIQRAEQVAQAVDAGAMAIVAQGAEAGGHGMNSALGRSSFTLVPEVADMLAKRGGDALLIGAGGVCDGRGLAAMLMLGADGAMIGSRAWATTESLAAEKAKQVALRATGDETMRSGIFDILREKNWPKPYDFRALRNHLHRQWEGREDVLAAAPDEARRIYRAAVAAEDFDGAHVTVGEGVGTIYDICTSAELIARISAEAEASLTRFQRGL